MIPITRHHILQIIAVLVRPAPLPALGPGEVADYIFQFPDPASPQNDRITGPYFSTPFSGLSLSVLMFDRSNNSTIPLSGYWFMITEPFLDQSLLNHPNCLLAINRSEQIKGNPAVLKNLIGDPEALSIMISGRGAHTAQGLH